MTSQAACRADPDASHLINVTNTVEIARRLVSAGARVVFPSTNHVFDGTVPFAPADRARCPDTVYGEQKAAAEEQLLALGDAVCVIRFGKILPHNHPMFSAWIADLAAGRPVTPFADVVFSPIDQAVAIDVLCRLGEGRHSGLWQLTANDDISYADAARRLAHGLGAAETLVQPVTAAEVWRGEPFPAHTTLDSARIAAELNVPIPTPYDELDRMIQTRTEG
jgi:dTDP-4-dehydrorhamnose reductase